MTKGYMVFEDGGANPISYGASEEWFSDYDDAIKCAMGIVNRRTEELKSHLDRNSVIVYEADEALKNQSHSIPGDRKVVFYWANYYKATSESPDGRKISEEQLEGQMNFEDFPEVMPEWK